MENTIIKLTAVEIVFPFSESGHVPETTFKGKDCWKDAQAALSTASLFAPRDGCYHKTDFTITWSDGDTYNGRLDLKHPNADNLRNDLAAHVRDHLVWNAGLAFKQQTTPTHLTEAQYKAYLKEYVKDGQTYLDYLREHELPCLSPVF